MRFFDAGCQLGRRGVIREGEPATKEDVLELMDRCRIEKAVACHAMAREGDMKQGNLELVKETEGEPRFVRQWVAMPSAFGEFMGVDELPDGMKENGVSSLRLFPKTHGFSIKPYALGKLMDAAAECRIPVFFDYGEAMGDEMYGLCHDYPDVNFVVTNTAYALNRWLGPVLDSCPNLYVGTGSYVVHGGLANFCKYYSAERLVFNTNLPFGSAAAAVSLVCFADISKEEKGLIAYGNLERLLGEVRL